MPVQVRHHVAERRQVDLVGGHHLAHHPFHARHQPHQPGLAGLVEVGQLGHVVVPDDAAESGEAVMLD
ncbi:hypothetical protein D3C81_1746790 [compost metagenome]